jgi:hypothetical protein
MSRSAWLALMVCLVPNVGSAQDLRSAPLPAIDDSALRADLRTAADTAALLEFALPIALDSLRSDSAAKPILSKVTRYPQLELGPELGDAVDDEWLDEFPVDSWLRRVCAPVKRPCRRSNAIRVDLEDQPGEGDNTVRLIMIISQPDWRRRRDVDIMDENEQLLRYWEIGLYELPVFYGSHLLFVRVPSQCGEHWPPFACMELERRGDSWRVKSWIVTDLSQWRSR